VSSGNTVRVRGYGIDQPVFDQRSDAQAVLDRYSVGETYPCWYDPATPMARSSTKASTNCGPGTGGIMLLLGLGLLIGLATWPQTSRFLW